MKLTLQNFGCWKNQEFTFQDTGLNLVSGPSGIGKTTILRAIDYALFGKGRKVVRDGEKQCFVSLSFRGLSIQRSNKSPKLIVNDTLEDQEAQAYIDEHIPSMFLEQNGKNTFVSMKPKEKLEFLENLNASRFHIQELKTTLEEKRKDAQKKCFSWNETREQWKAKRHEEPQFDGDGSDVSRVKNLSLDTLKQEKQQLQTELQHLRERAQTTWKQEEQQKQREKEYQDAFDQLQQWKERAKELEEERQSHPSSDVLEQLEAYYEWKSNREYWKQRYETQQNLYESIQGEEMKRLQEEEEALQEEYQSIEGTRKELKRRLENAKRLEELKRLEQTTLKPLLKELPKDMQAELEQEQERLRQWKQNQRALSCPKCHASLLHKENTLVCIHDNNRTVDTSTKEELQLAIQELKQYQQKRNELVAEQTNATQQLEELRREQNSIQETKTVAQLEEDLSRKRALHQQIEERRKQRENQQGRFQAIENELDRCKKELDTCDANAVDLSFAPLSIEEFKQEKQRWNEYQAEKKSIEEHISHEQERKNRKEIECQEWIQRRKEMPSSKTLYETITQREETLALKEEQIEVGQNYQYYQMEWNQWNEIENEYAHAEKEWNQAQQRQKKVDRFARFVEQAEDKALECTRHSLETHAQLFLNRFFVEEPMTVSLVPTKKGVKKDRRQITLEIVYKGMSMEPSMLSGGEYDRLVLAYVLSIAEYSHAKLLLLDECISSLDAETAETVCKALRDQPQPIFLIAHQIISGMFDNVLSVESMATNQK